MRKTRKTPGGVVALTVVAVTGATSACASVSQEDFDAGLDGLRSELMTAIEAGDANNAQAINNIETRMRQAEARLQQFSQDLSSMEQEYAMTIERLETSLRFNVPVYFGFNEAELTQRSHEILDRFHAVADEHYPTALITVEGHTDALGTDEYNQDLGMRRAASVRTYLVDQGMVAERVRAVSYGEALNRQNAEGQTGPGTAGWENRRVVMVIDHDGEPPAAVTTEETVGVAARLLTPNVGM